MQKIIIFFSFFIISKFCYADSKFDKIIYLNKLSNYLAGTDSAGTIHAKSMDELWDEYYKTNFSKLIDWQKDNIEPLYAKNSHNCHVFYPFSGPDIIHPISFFPSCNKFSLVGLEPIGKITDNDIESINLTHLRLGIYSLLKRSFFVTREMWSDFKLSNRGVTLPLLALITRLNFEIIDIYPIALSPQGEVIKVMQGHNIGVYIKVKKQNEIKDIYYFRQSLKGNNKMLNYLEIEKPDITYIKAAQYALFSNDFAEVRKSIIKNSELILQDDSGIPYFYFDKNKWNINLWGKYQGPYGAEFSSYIQRDLIKIYNNQTTEILPFNLGYGYKKNNSSLMSFKKKSKE